MIVALAGGVGGAKLAHGLAQILAPDRLTVIVNTGDDFEHLGLHVSPDLDTVMYTLAGINDPVQGWGLEGESWNFMAALERLGGETWFRLGDRDLATHVERTRRLRSESLSAVTRDLSERLGVRHTIVPMSDDPVGTMVETDRGRLSFQDYFVRQKCEPVVLSLGFSGAEAARSATAADAALARADLEGIVICPSNPWLSIAPMLAVPGLRALLERRRVPLVAVTPIVGGAAIKGPAAKIMAELGVPVSPLGVASFYGSLLDGIVIDQVDRDLAGLIAGPSVEIADTIMRSPEDRARLAGETVDFLGRLAR